MGASVGKYVVPIAGLGLSALGLISNEKARHDANNAQDAALTAQERSIALEQQKYNDLQDIHNKLWGMVQNFDQAGGFDPEYYVRQAQKDTGFYEGQDLGNLSGALRVLGYRPGSSEIGTRLDATKLKYRRDLNDLATNLRQNSIFNKLNAYNSTLGSIPQTTGLSTALNSLASTDLGLSQMYRSQIGNPANLLLSIMPFIKGLQNQNNPYGGTYGMGNNSPYLRWDTNQSNGTNIA